jgi:hypothetical protein
MGDADQRRPSPRHFPSHGLWSLWDMAELYAYSLVAAMRMLREGAEELERRGKSPMVGVGIQNALNLSNELGMFSTQQQVITAETSLSTGRPLPEVLADIRQLIVRIEEDLRRVHFLYVPLDMAPYWSGKNLFGDVVAKKFKAGALDIENAGKCLAVGQGTACVMHLDRAMEVALRHLAKRLRVPIGPKDTWGGILNKMSPLIGKMPETTQKQKTKRDRWSEARTHLFHVKEAWRDRPMHGKETYSPARAKEIFEAVKVFMAHLATL